VAKFLVSENALACSAVFRRLSDKLKKYADVFTSEVAVLIILGSTFRLAKFQNFRVDDFR